MELNNPEDILTKEDYSKIIKKKLAEDGIEEYSVLKYEVIPIVAQNGHLGRYFNLKFTVKVSGTIRVINFFAKKEPKSGSFEYNFANEQNVYKKEIDIYTKLFPQIICEFDKINYIPKCYFAEIDEKIIVLEDMTASGYKMTNKAEPFDIDHCTIILKTLAKFHSNSIIYEETKKKNIYDEFSYCLYESLWPVDRREGCSTKLFDICIERTEVLIDMIDCLDEESRAAFKKKFIKLSSNHCLKLQPSTKFRNVVCHGDTWANNLLLKYDQDGKPSACALIDHQLNRFNPPCADVINFLQSCTTKELREKHFSNLLKIYHESLSIALDEAGLNSTEVFPFDDFLDSVEDLRFHWMNQGLMTTIGLLLDPEVKEKYLEKQQESQETATYDVKLPLICQQFREAGEYRNRVLGSLLELHNFLINKN